MGTGIGLSIRAVLKVLDHLSASPLYVLQYELVFQGAVDKFTRSNADFSDFPILEEAEKLDCELFTFDRKLSKVDRVKMVGFG